MCIIIQPAKYTRHARFGGHGTRVLRVRLYFVQIDRYTSLAKMRDYLQSSEHILLILDYFQFHSTFFCARVRVSVCVFVWLSSV